MPKINDYKCDECGYASRRGWGGFMYVIDRRGLRIPCPHPGEYDKVYKVLGKKASDELIRERTGFNSDCVCLECLGQFFLDIKRDERKCPYCESTRIRTIRQLVDQICPKCKNGHIREIWTGTIC